MLPEIRARRSIRRYLKRPVPKHMVEEILQAGLLAPSSKNRQPWRFIVATGAAKDAALQAMERGLQREKTARFCRAAHVSSAALCIRWVLCGRLLC